MSRTLNALILDPDLRTRGRLKQALGTSKLFGEVLMANSVHEGLKILNSHVFVDVVFISSRLQEATIRAITHDVKAMFTARDAACILIGNGDVDGGKITRCLLAGVSGILLAPFSVEALVEVTRLARKMQEENSDERTQKALRFLIDGLRNQVDELANLKKRGHSAFLSTHLFREMSSVLKDLDEETRSTYFELLVEIMTEERTAPPSTIASKAFSSGTHRQVMLEEESTESSSKKVKVA